VNVFVKIGELKILIFAGIEIEESEGLEVANKDVAREFGIFEYRESSRAPVAWLGPDRGQHFSAQQESALPEEINKTGRFRSRTLYRFLEGCDLPAF